MALNNVKSKSKGDICTVHVQSLYSCVVMRSYTYQCEYKYI